MLFPIYISQLHVGETPQCIIGQVGMSPPSGSMGAIFHVHVHVYLPHQHGHLSYTVSRSFSRLSFIFHTVYMHALSPNVMQLQSPKYT